MDRGQIDDWFGSSFITWMFVIAAVCLTAAVFWELNREGPGDRLQDAEDAGTLPSRMSSTSCLDLGLFATTTMIPQILQSLYGYRAIDAGLVLGPGAFVITLLAPVGAQLVQRGIIHPRILLFGAVIVVGISMIHYSHFNLQDRLSALCAGAGAAGAGVCVLLCAAVGHYVLATEAGAE